MTVQVENISKVFGPGTANEKAALKDLTFTLNEGDFAVVIGSNGAGKSTLLNALAGEVVTDNGTIAIAGHEVQGWPVYKRANLLSRVFQDPMMGTAPALSIEENLAIALRRGKRKSIRPGLTKSDREQFREKVAVLGLGLENRLSEKVESLSGGQRQSLTLIMASLVTPQLLLLDEHTAALDPRAAQLVLDLTVDVVGSENITTLMVTHNMEHALQSGNRLFMMHDGEIILDLSGEEKASLSVEELVERFHITNDKMLLN